jgi:gluconate kinase
MNLLQWQEIQKYTQEYGSPNKIEGPSPGVPSNALRFSFEVTDGLKEVIVVFYPNGQTKYITHFLNKEFHRPADEGRAIIDYGEDGTLTRFEHWEKGDRIFMKTMYIMRGVPGSGKSYMAKQIAKEQCGTIFSTDDFFMKGGEYLFDPAKLGYFHDLNRLAVERATASNLETIVVDNTMTTLKEARQYCRIAMTNNYKVVFVEPKTEWAFNAEECARRNQHGVPLEAIERMLARYVPAENFTLEACLGKNSNGEDWTVNDAST